MIRPKSSSCIFLMLTIVFVVPSQYARSQSFSVIHDFTGGADGLEPAAGLTPDGVGNLYGTTDSGGANGSGVVFKLTHKSSGWILTPLYPFSYGGFHDGDSPRARAIFGPDGSLYGTASMGGSGFGGTVFNLRPMPTPPSSFLDYWNESVLHAFTDSPDGSLPSHGDLIFDSHGNIFGTTYEGGTGCGIGCGTVYELSPSPNGWTERVLHGFIGGSDGEFPIAGVILDQAGNLYGTTQGGFDSFGTVFQLSPAGSGWTEHILYTFQGGEDGSLPGGGLVFDSAGNLYGSTYAGGAGNGGTIFSLTPSGNGWTFKVIYSFSGNGGPASSLTFDRFGNLYGTTDADGIYEWGSVFKLTPSNGMWVYTDLYDFQYNGRTGGRPYGGVVIDSTGNLYGTTAAGGAYGYGVAFEITP